MTFNSFSFLYFFVPFFILYWVVLKDNFKYQNLLLLLANYFFYALWDWRFLSYLVGTSILNYFLGLAIFNNQSFSRKKFLLYIGLIQSIGGLAFFKYFNFFITSFDKTVQSAGLNWNLSTLSIIIPLGISFFTFRAISYILDVYHGKIQPTKDVVAFFAYISFFPTIISGPIDRSRHFIPQLEKKRTFDNGQISDGLRQILWGLFKKSIIADNCAVFTNQIFDHPQLYAASTLIFAAFFYAIQLYADFSGYSDMAIGISKLLGLSITKNFDYPFFAQNIAEYWRKWHISLTSWLTEYVFTPLSIAFRDFGKAGLIGAIIINFTICGIWHGANWTYVLFGFLHGCYFIPLIIRGAMNKRKKIAHGKILPSPREFINMVLTFGLISLTLVIFRSSSIDVAFQYYARFFSVSIFSFPSIPGKVLVLTAIMIGTEWIQREKDFALQINDIKYPFVRWSIYYVIMLSILLFESNSATFIYAQF